MDIYYHETLGVMVNQFEESKVATKVVVTNPSFKVDSSVEGDLLRIAQLSK